MENTQRDKHHPSRREEAELLKQELVRGVTSRLPGLPPEGYALSSFIEKLYRRHRLLSLDDVVNEVAKLLEGIERDTQQRERLLNIRREFCKNKKVFTKLTELLEAMLETTTQEDDILANYAVIKVLLAQCTEAWKTLSTRDKAEILAPLYMALHHLKKYTETKNHYHVEIAATHAIDALNTLEDKLRETQSKEEEKNKQ